MSLIFNLDLDNLTKVTDYGFNRSLSPPPPIIYFRLYKNGYLFDMSKFQRLTFRYRVGGTNQIYNENYTQTELINGERLVKVELLSQLLQRSDKVTVSPSVRESNKTIILSDFIFYMYEGEKNEMTAVKHALMRFNVLYGLYINAIKRDQINQPFGVVGLDGKGKIPLERLPIEITDHVFETVFNSEVHGLRINKDKKMLEYYDSDDQYWYEINVLYGGIFKLPTKSEQYTVYGGNFVDEQIEDKSIFGGTF